MTQLAAFFESVKLPSMSEVAHALIQSLNDDDVGIPEIRDLISQDPALSAKLLRLANCAQFGLPRGVSSLDDASVSFQSIAQWTRSGHRDHLLRLADRVWRDRAYGDVYAYMLLAEGRLEFVAEFGVKEYDIAALVPIVMEAGGRFTDIDGADSIASRSSLATNGALHEDFLALLTTPSPTGPTR